MLSLLLAPADGGTAWRHLLAEGEARAGFEAVGPLGLARRVARLLGVAAAPAPAPERLAVLAERLRAHDDGHRSYSASRRDDESGVAAFLLGLRDRLRAAGWDGRPIAAAGRLADLSAIESLARDGVPALPPGYADVEHDLAARLAGAGGLPERLAISLAAPRDAYAASALRLLDALARSGASVADAPPDAPSASPGTDLGRIQRALLDPDAPPPPKGSRPRLVGDGSFLLLEADTAAEAAELAASFLRGRPLSATTVVGEAEAGALDAALARQGLPALGAGAASRWRPALQVLPLRLALAFRPRDPLRAAELLLLTASPIRGLARRLLLGALVKQPGLWGPAWREAVDRAASAAPGDPGLRGRIEGWFGGETFDAGEGIPAARAAALCEDVALWASARARAGGEADPALLEAASVARGLARRLGRLPPEERLPRLALEQLHDQAVGAGSDRAAFDGEAGRPAVCARPADALPGAAEVLWWGFAGDGGGPAPEPWTPDERRALGDAGVRIDAPGVARRIEARGWRRPALAARERLVLVRWRLAGSEPALPHPLLDDLATRLAPGSLQACAIRSAAALAGEDARLRPAASSRPPAAPLAPRAVWHLPPEALLPLGRLSATSVERLLGCPMGWVLEDRAALRPGRAARIPEGAQLLGTFAHSLLQDLLVGRDALDLDRAGPVEAADRAAAAFDARVEAEAAPLLLAGRDVERSGARRLVAEAARALVALLRESKPPWRAESAEEKVEGEIRGRPFRGRVDLVLGRGGERAVLDLKLGNARYRRETMEKGTAYQLAIYAALLRRGGPYPTTGYFVLEDGRLLTTEPERFAHATRVVGPGTDETILALEKALAFWETAFSRGAVAATHETLEGWEEEIAAAAEEDLHADEPARPEPGCRFCKFEALCVARLGPEAAP